MSDIDPEVGKVLKECGLDSSAAWKHKQSGKWIVYHWALERAAAHKGVKFDLPQIIHADPEKKLATIVVTGRLGDASEWSFGEAAPYNTQQTYPFAMAEKRAKDRVILKLIGLHGRAYSEEEADTFKRDQPQAEAPPEESDPFAENEAALDAKYKAAIDAIKTAKNEDDLKAAYNMHAKAVFEKLSGPEQESIKTAVSETRAKWEQAA